jgi:DNA-binding NtrC family response regulator
MSSAIRVLVVDDESIVCDRLQPVLEKSGFAVETFTSSAAALERLTDAGCDILITDVKMVPPDGLELLKLARERQPGVRVIVITGFATVETAREALKGGAVDFIAKPFRLSHLRDLVVKLAGEIEAEAAGE